MKHSFRLALGLVSLGILASGANAQVDITRWGFSSVVAAPLNSPAPITGTGTASIIGMTGNGDVLLSGSSSAPDPNPLSTGYTWRVRGTSGSASNGWDKSAAQDTQGAQFMVSTVGFTSILLDFDWFSTNNGIRNLQVQYTLDGSTWNSYKGSFAGGVATATDGSGNTQLIATPNNYNTSGTSAVLNEADFSSIAGAANNAKFGVRLVSAWDTNLQGYAAATLVGGVPALWNGNSGNWRFDQIAVRGKTASVPEPMSLAIIGVGVVGLVVRRRRNVR